MNKIYEPSNVPGPLPQDIKQVSFSPAAIVRCLLYCICFLLLAHIAGFILDYVLHSHSRFTEKMLQYFDLNLENNFPSFFSALILAFSALLLLIIYFYEKINNIKSARYWLVLGLIFIFLSFDESIQIHEDLAKFIRPKLATDLSGFLYWAWVVPYAFFVLAVVIYFMRFVLNLPTFTRNLFFLSGFIYISGALGLELLEGYFFKLYGLNHIYNRILYFTEELMEMMGVTIFIYALLKYMASHSIIISIRQKPAAKN